MIHNISEAAEDDKRPSVVAKLCHLFLRESLKSGDYKIQLLHGGIYENEEVLDVQFFVDDSWKVMMKIPIAAADPMMDHLKSMCDTDLSSVAHGSGSFTILDQDTQASVSASFSGSGDKTEQVVLEITPTSPEASE